MGGIEDFTSGLGDHALEDQFRLTVVVGVVDVDDALRRVSAMR